MVKASLNPRQEEAVLHGHGPLLILAGAGTGKTRTIACRIARLVSGGVAPETILAVSFTNKAAGELRERVRSMLRGPLEPPPVSTFHSYCVRVLREDIEQLGFRKNFTIYDTADQLSVVREVVKEGKVVGRDLDVKRLLWLISRAKNDGLAPDAGDGSDEYRLLASLLYPRYNEALRTYNALDFDDLLLLARRLFREKPEVLAKWKRRLTYILVDEFQDTNLVQYDLIRLLAAPEGDLTVVGDDDQSIYGWRGAAPGNMHSFAREWPGTKVITLDQNYRSTTNILESANAVIEKNQERRPKDLWSDLGEGAPVTILGCPTGEEEAAAVVARIGALVSSGKCRPGDCAVMYRTNSQSRTFEDLLQREHIAYVVIGGMRFYDRKEVRDLLAYLSCLHNFRDEVSLLRIINYPARGIGRETIRKLQAESLKRGEQLAATLARASQAAGVAPKQAGAVLQFLEFLREARTWFRRGSLAEGVRRLVGALDLERVVREGVKDPEAGQRRVENLREVAAAVHSFEQMQAAADLGDYLAGVNLSGREEEGSVLSEKSVTLLTVHASKGLEFPHVFLAGLEEGLFPHERSGAVPGGLEEERRLAYVGMTRAMRSLTISHASSRTRWSREIACLPSRFLEELPEERVRREDAASLPDLPPEEEDRIAGEYLARIRSRL